MPHLSPMSWLMMLTFSTMMIMTLNSISWWNQSIKMPPLIHKTNSQHKHWSW